MSDERESSKSETSVSIANVDFTIRDLLNLYLREIENLQRSLNRIEDRIDRDLHRNEGSILSLSNEFHDDIDDLTKEVDSIKADIHSLKSSLIQLNLDITCTISQTELLRKDVDHQQNIEINNLNWKIMGIGGGSGVVSGLGTYLFSDTVINAIRDVLIAIIH